MTIVISAVNLRKGGTLAILRDCLAALSQLARQRDIRIVALVHKKALAQYDGIEYIELPWSTKSWVHRLWCEYMTMHKISRQLGDIDLWLSLHDTTPRVKARSQAVYCHNSYPFFRWQWRHLWLNYRIVCFALFTKWIYRINIHRNRYIIVQQEWFRAAFQKMFGLRRENIIVAHPNAVCNPIPDQRLHDGVYRFIYPAYPDVHKNVECICEAARLLEREMEPSRFEVILTTSACMNPYSQWICRKWADVKSIRFCGFVDRERLNALYAQADCLVFPSWVETWGLPISEFAVTGRPMLLADLPYTHETAAGSRKTAYFNPANASELKEKMKELILGNEQGLQSVAAVHSTPPCAADWPQLFNLILQQ